MIKTLIAELDQERCCLELNKLEDGKTVLDIVGKFLSQDHIFYLWLQLQGGFAKENQIQDYNKLEIPEIKAEKPKLKRVLTIEEGYQKIQEEIDAQLNSKELAIRKSYFDTKSLRKSLIEVIKTFQEASGNNYTCIIGIFEVVYINKNNTDDIFIIYLDHEIASGKKKGVHGSVYLVQKLDSSNQKGHYTIVKKIGKTAKLSRAFKWEALFADLLELSTGDFESDNHLYLFMLYAGISIADLPLGLPAILKYEIMIELLKAANKLHEEKKIGKDKIDIILHRDIKPRNIGIYQNQDGVFTVRIYDYGDARFKSELTREEGGSAAYQTPESFKENRLNNEDWFYTEADDNYGIAIIMAMLFLGYDMDEYQAEKRIGSPYLHSDLAEALPGVFDLSINELAKLKEEDPLGFKLIQIILKLTSKNPATRPRTFEIALMIKKCEALLSLEKEKLLLADFKEKAIARSSPARKRGGSIFNLPLMRISGSGSESPSSKEKVSPKSPKISPKISPKESIVEDSTLFINQVSKSTGAILENSSSFGSTSSPHEVTPRLRRARTTETSINGKKSFKKEEKAINI